PNYVYDKEKREAVARNEARKRVDDAAADAKALGTVEARSRDLEARIAARQPYDGQEAMRFAVEVSLVDLRYLGLPNRSAQMRALLKRGLEEKLIDPNVLVKGQRPVDTQFVPLFVQYYRAEIRPYPTAQISIRDWETLKLLVENGADLTLDVA